MNVMDWQEKKNRLAARVLAYVEQDRTHQAPAALSIPTTSYTDPLQYQQELEKIFRSLPLLFGFSVELPAEGDYKTFEIAGVPALLTRGADGTLRAFHNVCTHRGTLLADRDCGNARRFTCPYHGWTYRNDGQLIGVSEQSKFGVVETSRMGLVPLPCEERGGMIFGKLRPGSPLDLDAFYGDVLDYLCHYDFRTWTLLGKRELQGANWKVAYDGYLENYHFNFVHRDSVAPYLMGGITAYEAYGPHLHFAGATPAVLEMRDVPVDQRWQGDGKHFSILNLLFPNIAFSLGLGVAQLAQVVPGPDVGRSRAVLYHLARSAPTSDVEARALEERRDFLVRVLEEDYALGRRVQQGVQSNVPFNVTFGRNEPANQHFHKWIAHYLADGDARLAPKL
jgi:phenylpropionate dioxygenase-like ring-hydroxylating dioxygenase large terminal subunit